MDQGPALEREPVVPADGSDVERFEVDSAPLADMGKWSV